ncbi:fucolectin-like isoform X1 [Hemiscyllium ocellatum]|uniref:fucolectin-like isoform X1 n=2 Tax=Hemiscyllium ocellatum TaxID=170820 RepID=UPI002965DE42|nr:fucolectin-like isoform X1 [Hemiscyllium ocellatum]
MIKYCCFVWTKESILHPAVFWPKYRMGMMKLSALICVFLMFMVGNADENLSKRCRPTQSSVYDYRGHAVNAVDGNPDPNYSKSSCTATQNDMEPWWRADLLSSHKIHSIRITNRGDCCPQRLNGAEIRIGDSLDNNGNSNPKCATISSIGAGHSETFHCNGMPGRYVNIFIPRRREYLTLCEVEIFGNWERWVDC